MTAQSMKPPIPTLKGAQPDVPTKVRVKGPAAYPAPISVLNTPITRPRRDGGASDSAQTSPRM
jgi:hypothetical protein